MFVNVPRSNIPTNFSHLALVQHDDVYVNFSFQTISCPNHAFIRSALHVRDSRHASSSLYARVRATTLPMALEPPDPAQYVHAPRMTVEGGLTLCRVLADSCPASMPSSVKKAAKRLFEVAEAAQFAYTLRRKSLGKTGPDDTRPIDRNADTSWSALRGRLQAYAMLPPEAYPDAKRAIEILYSLFGESGLSFLTESYPEQFAFADGVLRRIDDENMATDIERLAGKEFLDNVRVQHLAYGKMVRAVLQREETLSDDLNEHVRAMGQEIVDYATKVMASIDRDKPATISAARTALRPIDAFREATQRRALSQPPAAPSTPTNGS